MSRNRRRLLLFVVASIAIVAVGWRPAAVAWHVYQGKSALRDYDADTAYTRFQSARELADTAEVCFWLARTCRRLGRMQDTEKHLDAAMERGWPAKIVRRERHLSRAQTGDLKFAERFLAEHLQSPGDDSAEICEAYVQGYFLNYRFADAFKIVSVWQDDHPDDPQPYMFRAAYAEHVHNWPEARRHYQAAQERAPGRHDIRLRLARVLVKAKEYQSALEQFRTLRQQRPDDPEVVFGCGSCYLHTGDPGLARQAIEQVVALAPDHFEGRLALAKLNFGDGAYQEAVEGLEPLGAERPYDLEARFALAQSLQAVGRSDDAKSHFDFVAEGRARMGEVHRTLDELAADSDSAEKRYFIGINLMKYDSPVDGAAWLQTVLQIDPDHERANAALADYFESIGRHDLSRHHREVAARGA